MQLLEKLLTIWEQLGDREKRVLSILAERLLNGQRVYGHLVRAKKNWRKEMFEENCDASIYGCCALVDDEDDRGQPESVPPESFPYGPF